MGGTLTQVGSEQIVLRQESGQTVSLQRLAEGATVFYEPAGSQWTRLPAQGPMPLGPACVETLMDGRNLLALKVFLGVTCGPASSA